MTVPDPLWVFAYGSLLWDPGFDPAETRPARLRGYHRSFCMLSIHHRGSEDDPGLVLALDRQAGAVCDGVALRVRGADTTRVLTELRERELISSAYVEAVETLETGAGEVQALAYVINRDHRQYCQFDLERQARMIAHAVGGRGPNTDYLYNTAGHLGEMGISDPDMDWLVTRVRQLRGG